MLALELDAIPTKILSVTPKKEGKKDDAPLVIELKMELDVKATDLLAYFHPTLRDFLFCDTGTRFGAEFKSFKWDITYRNLELEIGGIKLQAYTLKGFNVWPYAKTNEKEPDFRDCLTVSAKALIKIGRAETSPLNMLSEYINTELDLTVRPLQLDLYAEDRKEYAEEKLANKKNQIDIANSSVNGKGGEGRVYFDKPGKKKAH
ncbi:MAG: hypothetical protein V4525_10915 [Pseudomonadota bacterium]